MRSPTPARRGPKRQVAWKAARIEEKLDDLVSLLRSQRPPKQSLKADDNGSGTPDSENDEPEFEEGTFSPSTNITSDLSAAPSEVYFGEPSPTEADESLGRFRNEMTVSSEAFPHCNGSRNKIIC